MTRSSSRSPALVAVLVLSACASVPEGPVVPTPPCVEARFDSTVVTPDGIELVGRVLVTNTMRASLQIERVDYAADLHDAPILEATYDELRPIHPRGWQSVTVPIEITRGELGERLEDVLAEESVRVAFRGTVHPIGFAPVDFRVEKTIPMPKLPSVSIDGARGNPLDGEFTVRLCVRNPNEYALTFESIESFVKLNDKRYELLRSECFDRIAPGATGRIALTMQQTRGKLSSVLVNIARHGVEDFVVGGTIACRTPYALVRLPIEVRSSAAVAQGL